MMKYNIGEYVMVKRNLFGGEYYEDTYFNPKMEKYRGKIYKILKKNRNTRRYCLESAYHHIGDDRQVYWEFTDEMLDRAPERKNNMSREEAGKFVSRSDSLFDILAK